VTQSASSGGCGLVCSAPLHFPSEYIFLFYRELRALTGYERRVHEKHMLNECVLCRPHGLIFDWLQIAISVQVKKKKEM
jgi:hypothetical protein